MNGLFRLAHQALPIVSMLFAASCAPAPRTAVMGPSGSLPILEASGELERAVADGELLVSGGPAAGAMTITRHNGIDAIAFRPADRGFAVGRSVDSLLIATPYVEWTWSADRPGAAQLPIVIAVGLADPAVEGSRDDLAETAFGVELPAVDYLVAAIWTRDMTAGTGASRMTGAPRVGLYSVRRGFSGGREWFRDGIDLEAIVRRLWPAGDVYRLHVRYVAVIVPAADRDTRAMLGELSLHR